MDSLGDRMKENYENRYRIKLTRRMPVIIRLDGKSFHTLTRECKRPFDPVFNDTMFYTAISLCPKIQGVKLAYVQSDEISFLLTDYDRLDTEAWFDYNLQKMASVSAGMASAFFTSQFFDEDDDRIAVFDSRAFNLPKEEVSNYFLWRQKDWVRNSVQMLGQVYFSHTKLQNKCAQDIHEMLYSEGVNWADFDDVWKNGTFIYKSEGRWIKNSNIILSESREIIEQFLSPDMRL